MPNVTLQDRLRKASPIDELEKIIPAYSKRCFAEPNNASLYSDLAVALRCANKVGTATALYRKALALKPLSLSILSNLGGALRAGGNLDEAIVHLRKAVELSPTFVGGHFNLGLALEDAGRLAEALACYDRTLELEPNHRAAEAQKAFTLLTMGRFEEGFRKYEERFRFEPELRRDFSKPCWDGRTFKNQTLLLHAEQGRGDTFQFIRYAALAKSLGGRVIVECPGDTAALVREVDGVDDVVIQGQKLPHFDYQASLMSLPFIFRTTIETIPRSIPYLRVPKTAQNTVRLKPSSLFKVGIVWANGQEGVGANNRSISLGYFLSLLEIPRVQIYSLQVGSSISDLASWGCEHLIQDVGSQFVDFSHTADAIRKLDLIVTVDTGVAHLAAALGKPAWILLPFAADWRWLQHRSDSPWYPTARLYRQTKPMNWENVFADFAEGLKDWLRGHNRFKGGTQQALSRNATKTIDTVAKDKCVRLSSQMVLDKLTNVMRFNLGSLIGLPLFLTVLLLSEVAAFADESIPYAETASIADKTHRLFNGNSAQINQIAGFDTRTDGIINSSETSRQLSARSLHRLTHQQLCTQVWCQLGDIRL